MKQVILLAAFVITSVCAFSQSVDFNNPQTADNIVAEIVNAAGLSSGFQLKASDKTIVSEAFIRHHKQYIEYNPSFFNQVSSITHDKWAAIALFAHEIGHHVYGHTSKKGGSTHELELQADEFAGSVLRKMGASLAQAQLVMHYIATTQGSKTHPTRGDRMLAIQQGWNSATFTHTDAIAKSK